MSLTKYEKESIISWNQANSECSVYTFESDLKRRLSIWLTSLFNEECKNAASKRAKAIYSFVK